MLLVTGGMGFEGDGSVVVPLDSTQVLFVKDYDMYEPMWHWCEEQILRLAQS